MDINCKDIFRKCIAYLRLGREIEFGEQHILVIDCIESWLSERQHKDVLEIQRLFQESMQCQMNHNNVRLADILEYEVMPLIFSEES